MYEKLILINLHIKQVNTSKNLLFFFFIDQFILDNPNESHSESCLICLDNRGQISIYSLPTLHRQVLFNCIKPTNISALSSLQFTPYAHAFYFQSSSELTEVTFSPKINLSYSMMISYDKLQRKTILRTTNQIIFEKHQETTPSQDSIISSISPPKRIEPEEPVSIQNGNNSGFSTNSDSAIDVTSINNQPSK